MLTQENDKRSVLPLSLLAAAFLLLSPAHAAEPDPILNGPVPGPCAEQAAAADYTPGVDATGNTVVPAEGPEANSSMGDGTVLATVPRPHGRDVQVPVHLADLSPPSCKPTPRR